MKKYLIITYGCQMNIHESEKIAGILTEMGYIKTDNEKDADIIVFNTCCIRENAEDRAEGNKLKSIKKDLIIAVGGCMTQQSKKAEYLNNKFPFIDIIFGTHNLENFKELLIKKTERKKAVIDVWEKERDIVEGVPKTRSSFPNAWVNIMYGCNNFCSYCIVPYVRGRERSRDLNDILIECRNLINEGYKEITLLGQNVNSYLSKSGETFPVLLEKVANLEGDFRVRFMTNHPKDLSDDLCKVIKNNKKICNSIHLPVQSGSTRILKLMNRKYTKEDYLNKIELLRKYVPDIAITTDIMVGFPTETDFDHKETLDLMKKVGFSGAFTFVYSKRSGTPAAKMDGQIDEETSKKRIMELISYQNSFNRKKSKEYLGRTVQVLCEDVDKKKNMLLGRDESGRCVYFDGDKSEIGNFVPVKITKTGGMSLLGEIDYEFNDK